ncbi:hypothetical protein AB6N24_14280 [Cellulomonas sp. 179-A 4D5 NHS]
MHPTDVDAPVPWWPVDLDAPVEYLPTTPTQVSTSSTQEPATTPT